MSLQIDVGFGDAVTPEAEESIYPTLLEIPQPRIRIYPPETVVAEKLQAMVDLGMQNNRMKDFYDIYTISHLFNFKGDILVKAIRNTFERRGTEIPKDLPLALTDEFASDNQKQIQWKAFLNRNSLDGISFDLPEIMGKIKKFLEELLQAAVHAVRCLEDDPRFNAGNSSRIRADGCTIQMDASCMMSDGNFGAVACVEGILNPISLAQGVLLHSPHILLVGEGAKNFAQKKNIPLLHISDLKDRKPVKDNENHNSCDTVGAVACTGDGEYIALKIMAKEVYGWLEKNESY